MPALFRRIGRYNAERESRGFGNRLNRLNRYLFR